MQQQSIPFETIPSPCFLLEEAKLIRNLELLKEVQNRAGISIILALKGFSMWRTFPLVYQYLSGATASSLNEARLIYEEMGVKAHSYAAAYAPQDIDEFIGYSSHMTFNSLSQFDQYKEKALAAGLSCGVRVNPQYSEVEVDLYNPCSPNSRLGITSEHFGDTLPEGIEGLHFHALCESDSYTLENTLKAFEERFGHLISQVKWVNMGGGHLMTRKGYDIEHLITLLKAFKAKYNNVEVILEPGSAIAWQTGTLVTSVLDIVEANGVKTAMIDASFTAHMPDCLEMPYKPRLLQAVEEQTAYSYRIGGTSCLSGDFMSEYFFDRPLKIGDIFVFDDMIHYTMVKTTTFNGVPHPSIGIWTKDGEFELVKKFGYEDFKYRLS